MFDVNSKPDTICGHFKDFIEAFYSSAEDSGSGWGNYIRQCDGTNSSNYPSRLKEFFRLGLLKKEISIHGNLRCCYDNRQTEDLISPLGFILYYLQEKALPLTSLYLVLNEAHTCDGNRVSLIKLLSHYSIKYDVFNTRDIDCLFSDGIQYIIAAIASEVKTNGQGIIELPSKIEIKSNGRRSYDDYNPENPNYVLASIDSKKSINDLLDEGFKLNEIVHGEVRERAGVIKQKANVYYHDCAGYIPTASERFLDQLRRLLNYVHEYNVDIDKMDISSEQDLQTFIDKISCETTRESMYMLIDEFKELATEALRRATQITIEDENTIEHNWQEILQGPPGTGKSYQLKKQIKQISGAYHTERIVCHPEMTNAHFIGAYRPQRSKQDKPTDDSSENKEIEHRITYSFDPGPLTRMLKSALENYLGDDETKSYILIIEELNRANSAAMFADAFQLLDRTNKGWSEHATHLGVDVHHELGEDLLEQLKEKFKEDHENATDADGVRFPPNLYLWATMNTADQGVFPMDTAFKRRWSFKYLGVNGDENSDLDGQKWMKGRWNPYIYGKEIPLRWQDLRRAINEALDLGDVEEDRQLGPFFLSEQELTSDPEELIEHITNKVVGYLRDDVLRYEPHKLFKTVDGKGQQSARVPSFAKLRKQIKQEGILSIFEQETLAPVITKESFQKVLARFDQERAEQSSHGSDEEDEAEIADSQTSENVT